jgi:hypothetical protein
MNLRHAGQAATLRADEGDEMLPLPADQLGGGLVEIEEDPEDAEHLRVGGSDERPVVALRERRPSIPEGQLRRSEVERLGVHEDPVHVEQDRQDHAHAS